ncbi:hypothetical protein P7C70_g5370, partial [Phenoliferia sp. Uapishka_3]
MAARASSENLPTAQGKDLSDARNSKANADSLSSLSLVNKEVRGLAAVYLIKSRRDYPSPETRLTLSASCRSCISILHRTRSFDELSFLDTDTASPTCFFIPPRSNLLTTLSLSYFFSPRFGPSSSPPRPHKPGSCTRAILLPTRPQKGISVEGYRAGILKAIQSRIENLNLAFVEPAHAAFILRQFPTLKVLSRFHVATITNLGRLGDAIPSLPFLRELAIHMVTVGSWPSKTLDALVSNPPLLTYLTLRGFTLDDNLVNLVTFFSTSLETLDLGVYELTNLNGVTRFEPLKRPRLAGLHLQTTKEADVNVLITLLRNTAVTGLYCRCSRGSWELLGSKVGKDFIHFLKPSLRDLTLGADIELRHNKPVVEPCELEENNIDLQDGEAIAGLAKDLKERQIDTA